jgi:hypothetical protein
VITLGACVAAVGASYSTEPVLPDGWAVLDRLDDGPVQAVLAEADGTRVLLLPGTNQWVDALRRSGRHGLLDVDARPVTYGSYRCHDGAVRYADRLERWEPAHTARLVVGHSLGAAVALLIAGPDMPALAVAPFAPFLGPVPPLPALSLVDPRDVVPRAPGPGWHRPGAKLTLPPSRGTVLEAHGCGSYLAQLGGLAAFDLTPWLEEPAR